MVTTKERNFKKKNIGGLWSGQGGGSVGRRGGSTIQVCIYMSCNVRRAPVHVCTVASMHPQGH